MSTHLFVFPDTNLFVQCRALQELDWKVLGDAESISLVITSPVMTEIDRQKSGQGRLAKRARTANTLLRKLLDQDFIEIENCKSGVKVTVIERLVLKPLDELKDQLDFDTLDGQLVGVAAGFVKAHSGEEAILLSHDTGPLLHAKRVGVPFFQIPDEWLTPPETDEDQKRIAKLEKDLDAYRKNEPECTVDAVNVPSAFTVTRYGALSDEQVKTLTDQLRKRHPIDDKVPATPLEIIQSGMGSVLASAFEKKVSDYRKAYSKWIANCEKVFRSLPYRQRLIDSEPIVGFRLSNSGTRPADRVLVQFEVLGAIGGLFAPRKEEKEEAPIRLPSPPMAPNLSSAQEHIARGLGLRSNHAAAIIPSISSFPSMAESLSRLSLPSSRDDNSFYWSTSDRELPHKVMEFTCGQWRHQDKDEDFEFRLYPPTEAGEYSGAIKVTIQAANLTTPVSKTFPIKIVVEAEDAMDQAMKLIVPPVTLQLD